MSDALNAPLEDDAARRILNLLFLLNSTSTPLDTDRIVGDSDLGYGSDNRESDMRKFRRDREKLAEAGVRIVEYKDPGESETERSRWILDRAGTFANMNLLAADDADLLRHAIDDALRSDTASPWRSALLSLRAGIAAKLPEGAEPNGDESQEAVRGATVMRTLWEAYSSRRGVTFVYTDARGTQSRRTVDPYGMFTQDGHAYLVGLDVSLQQIRTFRCDRIVRALRPRGSYRIPPDFALADYVFLPSDFSSDEAQTASFSFPPEIGKTEIETVTHGRGEVSRTDSGWRWTIAIRDVEAAARMAASHASLGMLPVSPDVLMVAWRDVMERTVALHETR